MVFRVLLDLVTGVAKPALEQLLDEFVRFDDNM
jgi:hypothetical protein